MKGLHVAGVHQSELNKATEKKDLSIGSTDLPEAKKGEEDQRSASKTKSRDKESINSGQGTADQTEGKSPDQGYQSEIDHDLNTPKGLPRKMSLPTVGSAKGKLISPARRTRNILKILIPRFVVGNEQFQVFELCGIITGGHMTQEQTMRSLVPVLSFSLLPPFIIQAHFNR